VWSRWLDGDLDDGPVALILGPFALLGMVLGAVSSPGPGLVAALVLIATAVTVFLWDRARRKGETPPS
jgi:hypothetical protein